MSRQRNLGEIGKKRENRSTQSGTISAKQTRGQRESEDSCFCSRVLHFKWKADKVSARKGSCATQRCLKNIPRVSKKGDDYSSAAGEVITFKGCIFGVFV